MLVKQNSIFCAIYFLLLPFRIGQILVKFTQGNKVLYHWLKEKLGELLVSLTYHPAKNTLTIVILKAKNLKAKDINGKSGKIFGRHDIQ
jgi:hypothetical protein